MSVLVGQVKITTSIDKFFKGENVEGKERIQLERIKEKLQGIDVSSVSKLSVFKPQYWKVRTGFRELSKFTATFIENHPHFLNEKKAVEFSNVLRSIDMRPAKYLESEVLSRMDIAEGAKAADPVAAINQNIRIEQQKIQEINKTLEKKNILRNLGRRIGPVGSVGSLVGLVLLITLNPFTAPVFAAVFGILAFIMAVSFTATLMSLGSGKKGNERAAIPAGNMMGFT